MSVLLGMSVMIRDSLPETEKRKIISVSENGFEIDTGEYFRTDKNIPQKESYIVFSRDEIHFHDGRKYIDAFKTVKDENLRNNFISFLNKRKYSHLLTALASGERNFSEDEKWIYVNGGIMHLIALSAFHIGILFLFFNLFRASFLMFIPLKTVTGLAVFHVIKYMALFYYIYMTGFAVPTVRAAFFIIIYEILVLTGKNIHKMNVYILSLIGTASFVPHSLESKSFMLSSAAVFAVINIWNKLPDSEIVKITATSLFVSFILIPLTAEMNGIFPVNTPFTNIISVPLMTAIIPLTIVSQFIFPFSENITEKILRLAEIICDIFEKEVTFIVEKTSGTSFALTASSEFQIIMFFIFLTMALLLEGKIKKISAAAVVITGIFFFAPFSERTEVKKIYLFPGKMNLIKDGNKAFLSEEKRYFFPESYVNGKFNKFPVKISALLAKESVTEIKTVILKENLPKKILTKLKKLPQFRKSSFRVVYETGISFGNNAENPDKMIWYEND